MATLILRMPDDKYNRLKSLAQHKNISVTKLMQELSTQALAEFDSEIRFKTLALKSDKLKGLELLAKLDAAFG